MTGVQTCALPIYFHQFDTGEYLARLTNDVKQLEQLAWIPFFGCVGKIAQIVFSVLGLAKSIEEIKSFLSRQKEVYNIPYETHPADRPRQCVFGGTSNALDFLPLDRSGNRRFIPVMVYPEQAEVHILEDEAASRAYIEQMWAEAMEIYRSGRFKLAFSPTMQRYLKEHQRDFMPEDTKAGMIQAYLDRYTGSMVCSKQLYKEALNHAFDEPKQWEIREINEIMNQCITGWRYFPNPRMFSEYGRQKGWERENPATDSGNPSEKTMDGFVEVAEQMELPF